MSKCHICETMRMGSKLYGAYHTLYITQCISQTVYHSLVALWMEDEAAAICFQITVIAQLGSDSTAFDCRLQNTLWNGLVSLRFVTLCTLFLRISRLVRELVRSREVKKLFVNLFCKLCSHYTGGLASTGYPIGCWFVCNLPDAKRSMPDLLGMAAILNALSTVYVTLPNP